MKQDSTNEVWTVYGNKKTKIAEVRLEAGIDKIELEDFHSINVFFFISLYI